MTNAPFRTVVCGFGNVADGLGEDRRMRSVFGAASHARILSAHPAFDWRAVVDTSDSARRRARAKWGIEQVVADASTLEGEPEVAVIATPAAARLSLLERMPPSLRAVLVEKPLGESLSDARAFVEACRERGVLVQVNYWRRAAEEFRNLADGGLNRLVGEPRAVFAVYGNGLRNNGSHVIDLAHMLLGPIVSARALSEPEASPSAATAEDVDLAFALALEAGATMLVQPLDFRHYREVGLDIWGTRGRVELLQESLVLSHARTADHRSLEGELEIASDAMRHRTCDLQGALSAMYDNLAAAMASDAGLCSPGEHALDTEAVLDAILRSAREGGACVAPAHHAARH